MKLQLFLVSALIFSFSALGSVSVFFNQNTSNQYVEPYRKISRKGDNLEEVLLKEIQIAKKSIFIAVQELRLPLVAQALVEKKNQGVDVRIVLENNYNFNVLSQRDSSSEGEHEASKLNELRAFVDLNRDGRIQKEELEIRDAIFMLQQAKIKMLDDTSDGSNGSGLMHHKFMIVDDKTTIVSSANFTMSCIHGDNLTPTSRGNANSMLVVRSIQFSKIFKDEFLQMWGNGVRGNFGHNKTYRGPLTTTVRGTKISVQFSPTSQRYHWEESVNGLIASHIFKAQKSIKAALFVFSDQKLADVMQERHESGAKIGVIIEPKFAYRYYSELLDMMGLEMLDHNCNLENGNNPWKNPVKEVGMATTPHGDVMHHKFAIIDNNSVVIGSQNWSDAANFINDETLVVIEDTKLADRFTLEYNRIKSQAKFGPTSWLLDQIKRQEANCRYFAR